jgi:hypothetical protein
MFAISSRASGRRVGGRHTLGPLNGNSAGFSSVAINGRTVSSDERVVALVFVTPEYFATIHSRSSKVVISACATARFGPRCGRQ